MFTKTKALRWLLRGLALAEDNTNSLRIDNGSFKTKIATAILSEVADEVLCSLRRKLSAHLNYIHLIPSPYHKLMVDHVKATEEGKVRSLTMLLHGERGTGKSFIAEEAVAVMSSFGRSPTIDRITTLDNNSEAKEQKLSRRAEYNYTIVLIDEVDRLISCQKDVAKLLGILDEYRRSPGFVILTTNNLEALEKWDSAITRKGRIDYIFEHKGFTKAQAEAFLLTHGMKWDYSKGDIPRLPGDLEHYAYTGMIEFKVDSDEV